MSESGQRFWDEQASSFDDEPDHGLVDAGTRAAWRSLLLDHLPASPADVVDLGCGTGTLSVLLACEGFRVRGVDFATAMVAAAEAKAARAGVEIAFAPGDAASPPFEEQSCDVVLSRHVLWAMPDPALALERESVDFAFLRDPVYWGSEINDERYLAVSLR